MIQAGRRTAEVRSDQPACIDHAGFCGNDVTLPGSVVTADIGDRKGCVQLHGGFERMRTSCGLKSKQNYRNGGDLNQNIKVSAGGEKGWSRLLWLRRKLRNLALHLNAS